MRIQKHLTNWRQYIDNICTGLLGTSPTGHPETAGTTPRQAWVRRRGRGERERIGSGEKEERERRGSGEREERDGEEGRECRAGSKQVRAFMWEGARAAGGLAVWRSGARRTFSAVEIRERAGGERVARAGQGQVLQCAAGQAQGFAAPDFPHSLHGTRTRRVRASMSQSALKFFGLKSVSVVANRT